MKQLLLLPLLFITVISFGQVPNYVPTDSLVGYWGFNGNANDESGNGNDGTNNGATLTADRFGNANSAYDFDGVNDYISLDALFNFPSRSISFFIFPDATPPSNSTGYNESIIFDQQTNQLNYGATQVEFNSEHEIIGQVGLNTNLSGSSDSLTLDVWHHVVFLIDTNSASLYVDANFYASLPYDSHSGNGSGNIAFVATKYTLTDFFNGKIDDIGIWSRVLDSCEIIDLYNAELSCASSINELDNPLVKLYPNPTSDQITIDIKGYSGVVNVEVYDLQGRLLETTTNTIVSLKKHAKGIYVLKVSYGEITEEVRVVRD